MELGGNEEEKKRRVSLRKGVVAMFCRCEEQSAHGEVVCL
jgi:hypothetical protein